MVVEEADSLLLSSSRRIVEPPGLHLLKAFMYGSGQESRKFVPWSSHAKVGDEGRGLCRPDLDRGSAPARALEDEKASQIH